MKKIGVLVVDDSAVVRQALTEVLARDRAIEVLAAVADPLFAMQRMRAQWPDVVVLDIEMPRMDGLTFLRKLMAERPTPVVVCSSLTQRGAATTMEALAAGAVAVVPKPRVGVRAHLLDASADLVGAVRTAAHANVGALRLAPIEPMPAARPDTALAAPDAPLRETTETVVALGTSTGGTQALEQVLAALPPLAPGIVAVQHMPEKFTAAFAQRLDRLCQVSVREAQDGDRVLPGQALIAPGGRHMTLYRSGARYHVAVRPGPAVHHHCPSVDVLFRSVAATAGANALGILMTGMGSDGAQGLLAMREAGAATLAQDEASSVVFGMPREAIRLGAAERVVALGAIPGEILRHA
jgi:two-component system chemotaxis response regulator CheB